MYSQWYCIRQQFITMYRKYKGEKHMLNDTIKLQSAKFKSDQTIGTPPLRNTKFEFPQQQKFARKTKGEWNENLG